jgi:hypothetical protein
VEYQTIWIRTQQWRTPEGWVASENCGLRRAIVSDLSGSTRTPRSVRGNSRDESDSDDSCRRTGDIVEACLIVLAALSCPGHMQQSPIEQ